MGEGGETRHMYIRTFTSSTHADIHFLRQHSMTVDLAAVVIENLYIRKTDLYCMSPIGS